MAARKTETSGLSTEPLVSPPPAAAPLETPQSVTPPELRIAMVVRGFRTRYGGLVHLAARVQSQAICGAGLVSVGAPYATEGDICETCIAFARGSQ